MSVKNQVEALLFSSGKAMEEEQLMALTSSEKRQLRAALKQLQKDYEERDTSLKLFNEGTSWKLLVRDEHIPLVRRIVADTELSRATLETLAVIAFNQPKVLQSKVVELRGGNAYEHIKELQELAFVIKEKSGRSFSLRLTEKFFDYFEVEGKDIRALFKDVKVPLPKEHQKQLGSLKIVDVPEQKEQKDGPLGKLNVVDVPEHEEVEPNDEEPFAKEAPGQVIETEEEKSEKSDFLKKIESQIESISARNDDRDVDEDFKPSSPEEEQTTESEEPEEEVKA
jgi:segregation and condensation protein B